MKMLFGLHYKVHNEIELAEVLAFKKLGVEVETSDYGNSGEANGFIRSIILVFKNAINLYEKARKQKSDIVYLNTGIDNKTIIRDAITIFILKSFNKKIKVVLKTHGTLNHVVLSKKNPLKNYLFKKVNLFLVLSKEELETFLKTDINEKKVRITANAIDKRQYLTDKEFRETFGLQKEKIILLFVGRFIMEKGILDVIEACKLLKENSVQFELFCLGDGPLFTEVKSLITNLDLQNNVQLLGYIPEKETRYYYSNCDILVLPTYHTEGFPMAIFQAVAAGKPVITTKIRASADHLIEYENCLWVQKTNSQELFEKILILARDSNLREKIRINNLALANNFTAEKIIENLNAEVQNLFN